jgi:hypothetical protein
LDECIGRTPRILKSTIIPLGEFLDRFLKVIFSLDAETQTHIGPATAIEPLNEPLTARCLIM